MRRNLLSAFLALALLVVAAAAEDYSTPEWRAEIAQGYVPYRKLAIRDFAVADQSSPHLMHTQAFIHYSYKARWTADGRSATARVTELSVRSGFNKNLSWRKPSVPRDSPLIVHEQGHLDISELHAADLRKAELPAGSGADPQAALADLDTKLKALCDRILRESQSEQDAYDRDTNHGLDPAQQQAWNEDIRKRLADKKITAP